MTPKKCMSIAKSLTNTQHMELEPLCSVISVFSWQSKIKSPVKTAAHRIEGKSMALIVSISTDVLTFSCFATAKIKSCSSSSLKFRNSEKASKIWRSFPKLKNVRRFRNIVVAFSEYTNFIIKTGEAFWIHCSLFDLKYGHLTYDEIQIKIYVLDF